MNPSACIEICGLETAIKCPISPLYIKEKNQ